MDTYAFACQPLSSGGVGNLRRCLSHRCAVWRATHVTARSPVLPVIVSPAINIADQLLPDLEVRNRFRRLRPGAVRKQQKLQLCSGFAVMPREGAIIFGDLESKPGGNVYACDVDDRCAVFIGGAGRCARADYDKSKRGGSLPNRDKR